MLLSLDKGSLPSCEGSAEADEEGVMDFNF